MGGTEHIVSAQYLVNWMRRHGTQWELRAAEERLRDLRQGTSAAGRQM